MIDETSRLTTKLLKGSETQTKNMNYHGNEKQLRYEMQSSAQLLTNKRLRIACSRKET